MSNESTDLGFYEGMRVLRTSFDETTKLMTRYVEKPVEEVKIVEVPKVTYVDIVKQVPDIRIETVEKEVEELYVDEVIKEIPVITEEEVIKKIPVKKFVEVPVERIREVKVDQVVTREEIVELPGEIVQVENHYEVQNPVIIPQYKDTMKPSVYQQLVKPQLRFGRSSDPQVEVNVYDYDPVLCKVLVHIPKPVKQPVWNLGPKSHQHQWITHIKDYDHLVRRCNPHLTDSHLTGLLIGDSMIQPIPDTTVGGLQILGESPLPGSFNYALQSPVKMPRGAPPDPQPIRSATYVNAIAREVGIKTEKKNPQYVPAISALKTLRRNKYRDAEYEKYLVQHHNHFSESANVVGNRICSGVSAGENASSSSDKRNGQPTSMTDEQVKHTTSPRHKIHSSPRKLNAARA